MFRKVFVTILSLSLIFFSCCYAYADGRTSDEVIRKQYTRPTGYDPLGQKRDKYNYGDTGTLDYQDDYSQDEIVSTSNTAKPKTSQASSTQSNAFSYESTNFSFKYLRHEIIEDKDGNTVLLYYYNLTSKCNETKMAMTLAPIDAYQHNVECDKAYLDHSRTVKEDSDRLKNLQNGGSVNLCWPFIINDMSDVKISITDWVDYNPVVKEYTLKL